MLSFLFGLTFLALPSDVEIKVTSFYSINYDDHTAEICGTVTGHESPSILQVVVDPKYKSKANYSTTVGKNGKFCLVVVSYTGTAEVNVLDAEEDTPPIEASMLARAR